MSDMNPRGVPIKVKGEERRLVFTINAVDAVQDKFDKTPYEVLDDIVKEYPSGHTMRDVIMILLDDENEREKYKDPGYTPKKITERELGWEIGADNYKQFMDAVFHAYNITFPKPDGTCPNTESGEQRN